MLLATAQEERREKFTPFGNHNGSLVRRQPQAATAQNIPFTFEQNIGKTGKPATRHSKAAQIRD